MTTSEDFEDGMIAGGFAHKDGEARDSHDFVGTTFAKGFKRGWDLNESRAKDKENEEADTVCRVGEFW